MSSSEISQLPTVRRNPTSSGAVEHHPHTYVNFSAKDPARNMRKGEGRSTSGDVSTDRMCFLDESRPLLSNALITRIAFLMTPPQTFAKDSGSSFPYCHCIRSVVILSALSSSTTLTNAGLNVGSQLARSQAIMVGILISRRSVCLSCAKQNHDSRSPTFLDHCVVVWPPWPLSTKPGDWRPGRASS